ncbi:hypothetical protein [Sulfurimonas paralvinellae]|uniref:STAS domain-containing protein n=1 Tax=Sulfurimonas paralvinellae TaxID=317658 RepID=A0A7M1B720_9BACT|nr:hypothetical protein [Sulfurimonas paralvinellae]QOP45527.1 hypothetical protein FM071_04205 [Sulfurimonas paralvinellae]
MNISSSNNTLTISGNIKSVSHFQILANELNKMTKDFDHISIHLLDSISITSSVIGYLCKLRDMGHNIELHVTDKELHDLLDDLNLLQILQVQHITAASK